jgi:chromosome segregation protein
MKGFKSFASRTEIPFENSMNVIIGPNGSGKSNITDAICFVLGRLSTKSMRAAKAANLIFAGTKLYKPSPEALVNLVFDNSDKGFPLDSKEIEIERAVRHNGQSVYKINSEVKTRQEVLELLAMTGIDPQGFNIVLQGEIQGTVRMHPEERRKVIEEVAGISVYETRKEKSLHELEKTEDKIKEVNAILRERTAYLKNLEQERQQALKFKHLEETVRRCKASILHRQLEEKSKEAGDINEGIEKKQKVKEKFKKEAEQLQGEIQKIQETIEQINIHIRDASGVEQETLHNQLADLQAGIAGFGVRKEGTEMRLAEIRRRREALLSEIQKSEVEIKELKEKSPLLAKKRGELDKKKQELEKIEVEKKRVYKTKIELDGLNQRLSDIEKQHTRTQSEISYTVKEMEKISSGLEEKTPESCNNKIKLLSAELSGSIKELEEDDKKRVSLGNQKAVLGSEIENLEQIKKQVGRLDTCPLCKSKITSDHVKHVFSDCDIKIAEFSKKNEKIASELAASEEKIQALRQKIDSLKQQISDKNVEFVKLNNIESMKSAVTRLAEQEKALAAEISELKGKISKTEKSYRENRNIDERYEQLLLEIEEISSRTEENIDSSLQFKERDLEKAKIAVKQTHRDEADLVEEIEAISENLDNKTRDLEKKQKQENILQEKFKKLFNQRDELNKAVHEKNSELINKQHEFGGIEGVINNLKIDKARVDAERESVNIDFQTYSGEKLIQAPISELQDKLQKSEDSLRVIGSVNLRALEVYDNIKKEYDAVAEKVAQIEREKLEILKIIEEINTKKRKTFMRTLSSINELFTRNFMQLSAKGEAFLDLENKEDPFAAGLDIIIRVGKGKYFDVTSMSGGEQTLIALSLIFAIQEYKPYHFYIFDEIDAALDKRNSERLATLIKKYMKTGQYLIITHNDAIITESSLLYGVTMQEGVSKILSMQV